jgi:hypothetical protein
MAFKLSKGDLEKKKSIREELQRAYEHMRKTINDANVIIADAVSETNASIREYSAAVEEAKAFCKEVAEEWQGDFDDRSEKWQEGEAGEAVSQAISDWEGFDPDEVEEVEFDGFDTPDPYHEDFEELPEGTE